LKLARNPRGSWVAIPALAGDHFAHGFRAADQTRLNKEDAFDVDVVESPTHPRLGEKSSTVGRVVRRQFGKRQNHKIRGIYNRTVY
jgi:hypothetical protein